MDSVTTLVLAFYDTDGNETNVTVKNPKMDLQLNEVVAVMEEIIENQGIISNRDLPLDSVANCYYRTVTKTPLTDAGGGE